MIRTKSQARREWYGWSFARTAYREGQCVRRVWSSFGPPYQCLRKPTAGPGKLYCAQHAKIAERETDR